MPTETFETLASGYQFLDDGAVVKVRSSCDRLVGQTTQAVRGHGPGTWHRPSRPFSGGARQGFGEVCLVVDWASASPCCLGMLSISIATCPLSTTISLHIISTHATSLLPKPKIQTLVASTCTPQVYLPLEGVGAKCGSSSGEQGPGSSSSVSCDFAETSLTVDIRGYRDNGRVLRFSVKELAGDVDPSGCSHKVSSYVG